MTESEEFWKIYQLDVVAVPPNRQMQRINYPDNIYGTEKEKWGAVVQEIEENYNTGRPVLVGTTSIETSELVSNKLTRRGVKHNVLNAKQHEREAEIVAQAGRKKQSQLRQIWPVVELTSSWAAIRNTPRGKNSARDTNHVWMYRMSEWDELTAQIAHREGDEHGGRRGS